MSNASNLARTCAIAALLLVGALAAPAQSQAPSCTASALYADGRGPIRIESDLDMREPLATLNGICPGSHDYDHILPDLAVTAGSSAPSSDPATMLGGARPLLAIGNTTQSLLVSGTRFAGPAASELRLWNVQDVDLVGISAPGFTLTITQSRNVRVIGAVAGIVVITDSSGITLENSQLTTVRASGVQGLTIDGVTLQAQTTQPLVNATSSTLVLNALRVAGTAVATVPCLRVLAALTLVIDDVDFRQSCPAGLVSATGTTIVVNGLAGTVSPNAQSAAAIAASGDLSMRNLDLQGGAMVVDLRGGVGSWRLEESKLIGQGRALLALAGNGAGAVHRNELRGNVPLIEASGSAPAVPAALQFTDNHILRDVPEAVTATGGVAFDTLVALRLAEKQTTGPNARGGPHFGGNWWERVGLELWDGNNDGFAEQVVSLVGTAVQDDAPLVPPNTAPRLQASMAPDPSNLFVRVTEGLSLVLAANGTDAEEGVVADVFWMLDGVPTGVGGNLTIAAPAAGQHEAKAVARDSDGAIDMASFPFTVLPSNGQPTALDPVVMPCVGEAPIGKPILRVGQAACLSVAASDALAGIDDGLDLLYLDDGDARVDDGDVRLGRSLAPEAGVGRPGVGFDIGGALLPVTTARVVLSAGVPILHLSQSPLIAAGDLVLGSPGQGARLQPHHAAVNATFTPACAAMPFGRDALLTYVDLDCSNNVTEGDIRLFDAAAYSGVDVNFGDNDVGRALTAAPTSVGRFDRDAAIHVLWTLETALGAQSATGDTTSLTPQTPGSAVVTAVVGDLGEVSTPLVLYVPVIVHSDLPPDAIFAVSPVVRGNAGTHVYRNQAITLTDISLAQPATPVTLAEWDVDGPSGHFVGTGRTFSVQLATLGDHTVRLTVTGANGLTDQHTAIVKVMQAPPSPYAELTPGDAKTFGHPIEFTADGSRDLGRTLTPIATGLEGLRRAATTLPSVPEIWAVDLDGDGVLDAGEPQLGGRGIALPIGNLTGLTLEPFAASLCLADADGDGKASRRLGMESLFLSTGTCDRARPGQVRLQALPGPSSLGRAAGTRLAVGDADVGLPLMNLTAALLARTTIVGALPPHGDIVIDLDGNGILEAEDVRLVSTQGYGVGSRVLPRSFADGGGALTYDWSCLVGCSAGPMHLSDEARFDWSFQTSGRKVVQLTLTDLSGSSVQQTLDVFVTNTAPRADFVYAPAVATPGRLYLTQLDDVRFDGFPSDDVDGGAGELTYAWHFSDGDVRGGAVVDKRFNAPGTYFANLTVTDGDDLQPLSHTTSRIIVIRNHPAVAAFQHVPQEPLTLTPVAFDGRFSVDPDGVIPTPNGYRWTIREGPTTRNIVGPLASHAFARAGAYDVTLEVTDARGDATSVTKAITILNRPPTPVITVDKSVGRAPQELRFSADQSTDPEVPGAAGLPTVSWDFGDGSTSTLFNPTHTYQRRGQFEVRLTVQDVDGAAASTTVSITMLNEAAIASIVLPGSPLSNRPLAFKALAFDQDGDPVTFTWDFGDLTPTVTGATVNHTYTRHGAYQVTVKARDGGGGETTVTRLLSVASPPPTATLKADKAVARVNENVSFVGSAIDDGTVVGHFIDFGDGASTFRHNVTHRYAKPGTYTVTYRASDDAGEAGSAKLTVRVDNPAPRVLALEVTPKDPKPGDLLLFRAIVEDEDPGVTYQWDFKDGAVSEQSTPIHVYRVAGTFNVVLHVVDAHGAKSTRTLDVVVGGRAGAPIDLDDVEPNGVESEVERLGRQDLPGPGLPATALGLAALAGLLVRRRR